MSTSEQGKKWEQDIANELRGQGWVVERVPGSGNRMGAKSDDLLFCHEEEFPWEHRMDVRGDDESGSTIERRIKKGDLDEDKVFTAEVKYRKHAQGFKTLYKQHFSLTGMEVAAYVCWSDKMFSAPAKPFFASREHVERAAANETDVPSEIDMKMPNGVKDKVRGEKRKSEPDFLFLRGSTRSLPMDWLAVWSVSSKES